MTIEIGRVCIKTAGREAGKLCVVIKNMDDNFVFITGPKSLTHVKRRKCNIIHLEPLDAKISIKSDASDSEVEAEYKKGDILKKYQISVLSVRDIHKEAAHKKKHEPKPAHKEEHKPEKPAEKPKEKTTAKKPAKPVTKKPVVKKAETKKTAAKPAKKAAPKKKAK
ncbi:MAG: 50S ribosomal protein L14e [Nanoarchaeota archaeon]|nr:50S ribosomal protein L14e [Nanoarchaeota archaeon]